MKNIIISILLVFIFSPGLSESATITVGSTGDYSTISEAVQNSGAGDTIQLLDPVHTESGITVNKSVTITGSGPGNTILQAADSLQNSTDRIFVFQGVLRVTVSDMTIRYGNIAGHGGAILVSSQDVNLSLLNVVLENNQATGASGAGGAIYYRGSSNNDELNLTNCSVIDNSSSGGGGAVYVYAGTTVILSSSFVGNSCYGGGGAIIFYNYSGPTTVTDSVFRNNKANLDLSSGHGGGAISMYFSGQNHIFTGTDFISNISCANGGAIYMNRTGATYINCNFTDNIHDPAYAGGSDGGGAILFNNSGSTLNLSTSGCSFSGNTGWGYGGAVRIYGDSTSGTSYFTDTIFNNNTSRDSDGGAIYATAPTSFTGCTLSGNNSSGRGGGIYCRTDIFIESSTFSGNTSTSAGGGASVYDGNCTILSSSFVGNSAGGYGGGVWTNTYVDSLSISGCVFRDNSSASQGGGAYLYAASGVTARVEDSQFLSNTTSAQGGGLHIERLAADISNCTFDGNHDTGDTGHGGGAVYFFGWEGQVLNFTNCIITNNDSDGSGGALRFYYGNINITECVVESNMSTASGGGISNGGDSLRIYRSSISLNNVNGGGSGNGGGILTNRGDLIMYNCTLYGNQASGNGGGIECDATTTINNCTMAGNNADAYGGGIRQNSTVTMNSTIVADNTAFVGDADFSGDVSMNYSLVEDAAGLNVTSGSNNSIGVDPGLQLFADNGGPTKTCSILTGSPPHENGANSFNRPTDQRGTGFPRVAGTAADIGAYELQIRLTYSDGILGDGTTFVESAANDGSIDNSTTFLINLAGDTFSGTVGENFAATGRLSVTNLPAGLSVSAVRESDTSITVTIFGSALSHANADDVTNLTFAFQDSAFSNAAAAGVLNSTRSDLVIDFNDPSGLQAFNASGSIIERSEDGGQIRAIIANAQFSASLNASGWSITGGPQGVSIGSVTRLSDTGALLTLSGDSNGDYDSSITDAVIGCDGTQNSTGISLSGTGVVFSAIVESLAYSGGPSGDGVTFREDAANNGSLDNSTPVVVTLSGELFTGSNGENFVSSGKVTVTNLPTGLSASVVRLSSTAVMVTLWGQAASHANADDVTDLSLMFNNSAFNGGHAPWVDAYQRADLVIDFDDPPELVYSGGPYGDGMTFREAVTDDGSIDNSTPIRIHLYRETFTGTDGEDFIAGGRVSISNLPTGLSASVIRVSETEVTVTLSGQAAQHGGGDDVSGITLVFNDSAFTVTAAADVLNSTRSDLQIDFLDIGSISLVYATTLFNESIVNDGSIVLSSSHVITIIGDVFTGSGGEDYVSSGKVDVYNLPAGLSVSLVRVSATGLSVRFNGNAASHSSSDSISDLTFDFRDSAFGYGTASLVTDSLRNDLAINFIDNSPPTFDSTGYASVTGGPLDFTVEIFQDSSLTAAMAGLRGVDVNPADVLTISATLILSDYNGTVIPSFSATDSGLSPVREEWSTIGELDGTGTLTYQVNLSDGSAAVSGTMTINVVPPPPPRYEVKTMGCNAGRNIAENSGGFLLLAAAGALMLTFFRILRRTAKQRSRT